MFTFTTEQLDLIRFLRDAGDLPTAYRTIAAFAEGQEGVDPAVILWLRGSADVNEGTDNPYSNYIRGYTEYQINQRFGETNQNEIDEEIQNASNAIANNVIGVVLGEISTSKRRPDRTNVKSGMSF